MRIYTLFYEDTKLFNRSLFVMPNDEAAKKAMKLNLMDSRAENFRNEAKIGKTYLVSLADFTEEFGLETNENCGKVCNLKELLDDNGGNPAPVQ